MFVGQCVQKTNNFVKVTVCFQFHFNRLNSVEKRILRTKLKKPHFLGPRRDPIYFWQNRQLLVFNLIEYYNL